MVFEIQLILPGYTHGANGDVACDEYHKYKVVSLFYLFQHIVFIGAFLDKFPFM